MRRRASNVYGRPLFLGRVGAVAFAVTLLSFVLLARSTSRATGQGTRRASEADTAALVVAERRAAARVQEIEGALAAERAQLHASAQQRDAIAPEARASPDSLVAASAELTLLLDR